MDIPEGFDKVINDFIQDIETTFPEYSYLIKKIWIVDYDSEFLHIDDSDLRKQICDEDKNDKLRIIYNHCTRIFPERFFDIIYENKDIFNDDSVVNTEFLPRIVFKHLWNSDDITEKTRETIWKYLQLILMTIISSIDNKNVMGDTAKLFEAVDETELKTKLEETLNNIQTLFEGNVNPDTKSNLNSNIDENTDEKTDEKERRDEPFKMPNADDINSHLQGMLNGKLGKLAMELAEETAKDLNIDPTNIRSTGDVFSQMFKNPGKLINMMKNVGDKIDNKIKSGEISESELMTEGLDMLNKMKNNGNMASMQELFKQMGLGNIANLQSNGRNDKLNISAMQSKMEQQLKQAKMKDRMKKNAQNKKEEQQLLLLQKKENDNKAKKLLENPKYSDQELIETFTPSTNKKNIKQENKPKKKKTS